MSIPASDLPPSERLRLLELVVQHTSSMVVITDAERRVRWVNPAYTAVTGWTLDEVRGRHPGSFLHGPRTSLPALSRLSRMLRRGEPVRQFELLNYKKSGDTFWVSLSIETIRDANGGITEYAAIQEDISDRKQRELESAQLLRRLARAQRLAKLGSMEHQLKSGCVYCSSEIFRILEAGEGEVDTAYESLMARTHPDDRAGVQAAYEAAVKARSPYESEHRVVTLKGRVKWVHMSGTLEAWHDGAPTICRLVVQDVTERKQAETLARDKAALEQVARTQLEVLTRVSHELRTPLHAVLGFAEMVERLEAQRMSERSRGHMAQIRQSARHLLAMVNDILDMARARDGRLPFDMQAVALEPLAREAAQMLEPMAAQRQVRLGVTGSAGPATVHADRQRLLQVVINLASNAIKYSRIGGQVRLRVAEADGQRMALHVEDNGPGIASRHLGRLFEPFYRVGEQAGDAGQSPEGSGLGLAIARSLVDGMGGSLRVHSRPGKGSTFSVQLPRANLPAAMDSRPQPATALAAPAQSGLVLYIEDSAVNRHIVEAFMLSRPGLTLATADTGLGGLEQARRLRPDLVLIDMQLPDIGGLDVLQRLLDDPVLSRTPCIAFSANTAAADIDAAIRAGFREYLHKPIGADEFLNTIDRLLAERQPAAAGC